MLLAFIAFLEFLEMGECMVPGFQEEFLAAALPVVFTKSGRACGQHRRDSFQELERNQVESWLAARPRRPAGESMYA